MSAPSQQLIDCGDVDGSEMARSELAEASGHRPALLEVVRSYSTACRCWYTWREHARGSPPLASLVYDGAGVNRTGLQSSP